MLTYMIAYILAYMIRNRTYFSLMQKILACITICDVEDFLAISRSNISLMGCTRDTVGECSLQSIVAIFFSGPRMFTSSSASDFSVSERVTMSFMFFLISLWWKVAKIAGCCSKYLLIISKLEFHLVLTSWISLCSGSWSALCFSFKMWVAVELEWKNVTILLIRPSNRETEGIYPFPPMLPNSNSAQNSAREEKIHQFQQASQSLQHCQWLWQLVSLPDYRSKICNILQSSSRQQLSFRH